jgi:hypothetical protein
VVVVVTVDTVVVVFAVVVVVLSGTVEVVGTADTWAVLDGALGSVDTEPQPVIDNTNKAVSNRHFRISSLHLARCPRPDQDDKRPLSLAPITGNMGGPSPERG